MKFIESVHKYMDEDGDYTPVSYFIKSFQEYVDWDAICRKKAEKLGVSFESLRAEWDHKRDSAATRGTGFHKRMEDQMVAAGIAEFDSRQYPLVHYDTFAGVKEDSSLILENGKVYAEKMIWSKKYKVCGTADLVRVADNKIHVLDYKTNAKLDKESWRNPKTGKGKKLLGPVKELDDCNFNLYQLQLNTYMYMLLMANRHLKLGSMTILHIICEDENCENTSVVPHKVTNLQTKVKQMFKEFTNGI